MSSFSSPEGVAGRPPVDGQEVLGNCRLLDIICMRTYSYKININIKFICDYDMHMCTNFY